MSANCCDRILADFRAAGIEVKIVSGGSTPTLYHSHEIAGLTEIRPGTYVFNDINTIRSGGCALEDCAASVLATVVSTARPGQMIVDGGSKTFSSDRLANSARGHLRPPGGGARRALPQDERRARLRRHHPCRSASFRSATAYTSFPITSAWR